MMNIVITGVGGQGNVLASRILARAALEYGLPVQTSEAIGMAQREGVVMSQVRLGEGTYGCLIPDGQGDILLGFELAETVRGLRKLKAGGTVVANLATIYPVSVSLGLSSYQAQPLIDYLKQSTEQLYLLDATALAQQAGNVKATNIVLLGALSALNLLPYPTEHLQGIMLQMIPSALRDLNIHAFTLGQQAVGGA